MGLRNVKSPHGGMVREIDPEEAAIVRRMAREAINGLSLRAIAKGLTRDGIPTPRGNGAAWDPGAVRRVLTNPALIGATRHGHDVVRDEDGLPRLDPACQVLDVETFERLQEAVKTRGAAVPQRPATGIRLLLDGLVFCATCGRRLVRQSSGGGRFVNYSCSGASGGRCAAPATAAAPALEALVVEHFLTVAARVPMTRVRSHEDPEAISRLRLARAEIERTVAAMSSATPEGVADLAARLATLKRTEADARDAVANRPVSVIEDLGYTYGERFEAADTDERRDLLGVFLARVAVGRAKAGAGRTNLAARVEIEDVEPGS
jgi:hypothetical protein